MKSLLILFAALAASPLALGHPIPDIPVRGYFHQDGTALVRVEIDPRCFASDPLNEPYLENAVFQGYSKRQKSNLKKQAADLIAKAIEFRLLPKGTVMPKFKMRFTTFGNRALEWNSENPASNTVKCAKNPVMITAEWDLDSSKASGYQIAATKSAKFSVQFINTVGTQKQDLHVLFPGEESYVLRLRKGTQSAPARTKPDKKPSP